MSVVSISFLLFVALAVMVYHLSPGVLQPWVLLIVSTAFYLCFGTTALLFVVLSALSIWLTGLACERFRRHAGLAMGIGIALNAGLLLLLKFGAGWSDVAKHVVVPLGLSFYSLQAIGYCVDVCQRKIAAERNPFRLLLFLIFFPTIMQGPISRYGQIGGQLWSSHRLSLDRIARGAQLLLWGYFLKTVIADRAAMLVNPVFASGSTVEGLSAWMGVLAYSVQIYADFSGCVNICRGVAEMLGIDLVENFAQPYFATSVADFWHRWHISLSTWLRDYVYIPLGGNRKGQLRKYLNVLIVFAVSGLWHGVGLTFVVWGLLHGLYQVLAGLTDGLRQRICRAFQLDASVFSFRFGQRVWTFALVTFAWIFFRAASMSDALSVVRRLGVWNPWTLTTGAVFKQGLDVASCAVLAVAVLVMFAVSLVRECRGRLRNILAVQALPFRWLVEIAGLLAVLVFGVYGPGYDAAQFIYMQF